MINSNSWLKNYPDGVASKIKFDIQSLMNILPHRYPFLLIDRITDLDPGKVVRAIKK